MSANENEGNLNLNEYVKVEIDSKLEKCDISIGKANEVSGNLKENFEYFKFNYKSSDGRYK